MASLTTTEFNDAVGALAEHYGVERLRDKLADVGAFKSRKGLTSATAIADRLHRLSGGLRMPVIATYAFSHVWGQMLNDKLGGEENAKTIEELAEKVNACLDEKEHVVAGKEADLDAALSTYREGLKSFSGSLALLRAAGRLATSLHWADPAASAADGAGDPLATKWLEAAYAREQAAVSVLQVDEVRLVRRRVHHRIAERTPVPRLLTCRTAPQKQDSALESCSRTSRLRGTPEPRALPCLFSKPLRRHAEPPFEGAVKGRGL